VDGRLSDDEAHVSGFQASCSERGVSATRKRMVCGISPSLRISTSSHGRLMS
jgi:hypothetical protein